MKKNLFFLYLFISIFMHHGIMQSYDPQCIFTPDLGGLCNNQQNKQSKFQSAFAPSSSATSPQTVGHIAGLTAGAVLPAPHLHLVMDHLLSLRPVITQVQQASGQAISKFYMMSKQQAAQVYEQSVELLQLPEFVNFNLNVQTILGSKFFTLVEQDQYALMPAFASGLENNLLTSADQVALTQLYNQSNASIVSDAFASGASQVVSNVTRFIIENNAHELSQLVPAIRQLQDLANFTRNFTNLADLIPQDILYLHRIYELQEYRAQIVNYLQEHKPYFIYEGQQYFIEDIASYHIHAGDYFRKKAPKGGHSNYGGNKLDYFNPELIASGPHGTKKMQLHNSRFSDEIKDSSIYPENWSEFTCDINAIEMMMHKNAFIKKNADLNVLDITGYTPEGFKIQSFYDIENKRIRSHYPKFD